jgi:NTE family protein
VRKLAANREKYDDLALVLGGGGAHAAYEVGFLRCLARYYPDLQIPILTGVSAGAINAVFLANHSGPFGKAVTDLSKIWRNLTIDQVFRIDSLSLLKNYFHWQASLISGGLIQAPTGQGLVDPGPLRHLLRRCFSVNGDVLGGIEANLRGKRLKAVAVTGTDYGADRAVTWVQGRNIESWERPHRGSLTAELTVEHIMASTALPLFFPAVRVDNTWYGDGGMRQSAPLAPALHLGANRILAVSTRFEGAVRKAEPSTRKGHPPPAQVIGTLLNSIFLDMLVQDARVLKRINRLVRQTKNPPECGAREVGFFLLQPSRNIGELSGQFRHNLPAMFNHLVRGLGTHRVEVPHWLSIVMFDAPYLQRMMEIGEADAEKKMGEISDLLEKD